MANGRRSLRRAHVDRPGARRGAGAGTRAGAIPPGDAACRRRDGAAARPGGCGVVVLAAAARRSSAHGAPSEHGAARRPAAVTRRHRDGARWGVDRLRRGAAACRRRTRRREPRPAVVSPPPGVHGGQGDPGHRGGADAVLLARRPDGRLSHEHRADEGVAPGGRAGAHRRRATGVARRRLAPRRLDPRGPDTH
jgi:hypothetical protein